MFLQYKIKLSNEYVDIIFILFRMGSSLQSEPEEYHTKDIF